MRESEARRSGTRRAGLVAAIVLPGLLLSSSGAAAQVLRQPADGPVDDGAAAPHAFADGAAPTVSDDGRFIAYLTDRSTLDPDADPDAGRDAAYGTTVAVHDRELGVTFDALPAVAGARGGAIANPVLAGDGCSLVLHTEIGLDLFRDDDGGNRWDLYRTVLPHCGGTVGEWDLVSTVSDLSSVARDDLDPSQPASVSRAGDVVAYTHPADDLLGTEAMTTVSLVDLTVAIGEIGRVQRVRGLPIDGPNSTFVHRGIDQPAVSADGRFVAYRSDATSSDAVPGWGVGEVDGGPATRNVYVWDRMEADPFVAVRPAATLAEGALPVGGSADPRLSRDGSVVVFTSADPALIEAAGALCPESCVRQVFVHERDVDGNGRYDEFGRTRTTVVSASPIDGDMIAASSPAIAPDLSTDGSVVAFVSKANNLSPVHRTVGGESSDGHLWTWTAGELERIDVIGPNGEPVAGVHRDPRLDESGRTMVYTTLVAVRAADGSSDDAAEVASDEAVPADEGQTRDDASAPTSDAPTSDAATSDATNGESPDPGAGSGDGGAADGAVAPVGDAAEANGSDGTGADGSDDEPVDDRDDPAGDDRAGDDRAGDDRAGDDRAGGEPDGAGDGADGAVDGDGDGDTGGSAGSGDDAPPSTPPETLRSVGIATAVPELFIADVDFGTTIVGLESDEWYVTVTNEGRASFRPTTVGTSNQRFAVNVERSSCMSGVSVPPGGRCQIAVSFTPSAPGRAGATLRVAEEGFLATEVVAELTGGTGEPILRIDQSGVDFQPVVLGESGDEMFVDVSNISPFLPTRIVDIRLRGAHPEDFVVSTDNCVDRPFNPRAHCSIGVTFVPTDVGRRTALVEVATDEGQYTSVIVAGHASLAPSLSVVPVDDRADDLYVRLDGYPANSDIVLDLGGRAAVQVTTDETGAFAGVVERPAATGSGAQLIIAEVEGRAVDATSIEVPAEDPPLVGMPGFGLG